MFSLTSKTHSPYKIPPKKQAQSQNQGNTSLNNSQMANSYYSPKLQKLNNSNLNLQIKMRVQPLSANKQRRKISSNNQSLDSGRLYSPYKFPTDLNLANQTLNSSIYNKLKLNKSSINDKSSNQNKSYLNENLSFVNQNQSTTYENKSPVNERKQLQRTDNTKQFVLRKIDQKQINYHRQDVSSRQQQIKNSCSPNFDELETSLDKELENYTSRDSKINYNKNLDNSKTSECTDDTENRTSIQILKNSDEIDNKQFSLQYLSMISIQDIQDEDDVSENDSEEDYNVWPNNDEVLMRGIDFENFTDSNSQQFYPQVLFKVRSVFYNQYYQGNNNVSSNNAITNNYTDTNKRTKIAKSNVNKLSSYQDMLDYMPNDKKIQQDYSISKEFFQTRNQNNNDEQQPSTKKLKNHFIIQLEREKFFQNIQIYPSVKQTPQYIAFQKYFVTYKKDELNKQRSAKYSRYPIQTNSKFSSSQIKRINVSSSIKGPISIQTSPQKIKQQKLNQSFNNLDNQSFSSVLINEKYHMETTKKRCASIIQRNNNRSVNFQKSINSSNIIQSEMYNPRTKILKKSFNNIFEDNIMLQKN